MNRQAVFACVAAAVAVTALIASMFLTGNRESELPARFPVITSTPGAPATPVAPPVSLDGGELEGDVEIGDVLDVTDHEATAAKFASAFYTFDLDESAADRDDRLKAAGLDIDGQVGVPSASAPDTWNRTGVDVSVRPTTVDLVAFVEQTELSWTFSVFVTWEANYQQPGSSQTALDRTELVVTLSSVDPTIVLSAVER